MFNLPNTRSSIRCGYKWDNNTQEYYDIGKGCGQLIFLEKQQNGKWKITNAENGRGGKRGEHHKCHNTGFHKVEKVNMLEYRWHMQHTTCVHCGCIHDAEKFPLCPNCYKLECRKCGNRQEWIDNQRVTVKVIGHRGEDPELNVWGLSIDESKPEIHNDTCRKCGGRTDVIKVRPYVV